VIPVFDIESTGWVNPIAVGFYDGYQYIEFLRESEEDDVLWKFLSFLKESYKGIKIYAHCSSKYDSKLVLASLHAHGETAVPEAGLIRLRWKETNICFEDSYLLLPMTLSNITKMFSVEEKEVWNHELGLRPWEMGDQLGVFRSYLKRDCLSLSKCLDEFCKDLSKNFNITPSISLSTTSVKAFDKVFYNVEDIHPNEDFEEFIRRAMYGGRNEVYKRYGENINMYDFHDMYTSCYDTPVPTGKMYWARPNLDAKDGALVEVTAKVPKDYYVGPLPFKLKGGLCFPVGEFSDWWDIEEVRNAVKQGCDITIRRQINCEKKVILSKFGDFVSTLRRRDLKKNYLWKMFGLSVSGKMGQSRWKDIIKYVDDVKDFEGYLPIDEDELYFQTKEYTKGRSPYIKPAVSMRIRSEARIRHLHFILEALKTGEVFYGDTDSIFTTADLRVGAAPGELEFLGRASRGYFIKQKLYAIIQKGKFSQKSAGYSDLRLDEEDFKSLLDGNNLELIEKVIAPVRSVIREKELELLERKRKIRGKGPESRISRGIDTKPICLPLS